MMPVRLALLGALSLGLARGEVTPMEKIDLLAGGSLDDWVFHLSEKSSLSTERNEVARLEDGVLQITGKGMGYVRTKEIYRDYHLVAEFKWGERTWSKRADRARDCGLLLHCHGPDGSFGGTWISCVQAQMLEGSTGDINVLQGKDASGKVVPSSITIEVEEGPGGRPRWKKGGNAATFPPEGKTAASIPCFYRDPEWKDVKGFRGKNDVENPVGEWNRLEVICKGGTFRIILNGVVVNEGRDASPAAGWIGVQNEWAECWFRRLELWPLGAFKEEWKPDAASTDTGYSETGETILPRRLPWSPEQSLAAWRIDGDYELQLVASEPLTCDPVDVVWDERGRMFVAEMGDYPDPAPGGPLLSRIRLLTDKDRDGRMDAAVTWADHLDHVQGMLPMNGGLLVTTRSAIRFLKDTDGDDLADENRILFRSNAPKHNQLQVSSPRWGLDNAVYLNNGLDGKEIYPEGKPDNKLPFRNWNLRYDPRTDELTKVTGKGQFGAAQDDWGRRFFCSNRNPAMFAVMEGDAMQRNPAAAITQGHEDIQPPGAAVWPVALSHTTSAAHAGTHTAACGLGIYRGGLMPDLRGNLFVCDPTAQLVTRNKLVPKGPTFTAERVGDRRDFLVSSDEWCRPVQVRNGPDGALYICDMYRRYIDHARFFPKEFAETNYMRAGFDHGRIWRLVPKGSAPPRIAPLPVNTPDLVALLESTTAWQRVHAQRLIVEREDRSAVPVLDNLFRNSPHAHARVHAFRTLHGLGALTDGHIARLLADPEPAAVESAVQLANPGTHGQTLLRLAREDHHRANFLAAVAIGSGEFEHREVVEAFTALLSTCARTNPWMRKAVLSAKPAVGAEVLTSLLAQPWTTIGLPEVAREFTAETAARGDAVGLRKILLHVDSASRSPIDSSIVEGLATGLRRSSLKTKSLTAFIANPPAPLKPAHLEGVQAVLDAAESAALDRGATTTDRLAALRLVEQHGMKRVSAVVDQLLDPAEAPEIQTAACKALSRFDRKEVAGFLFDRWNRLGPTGQREALAILTSREDSGLLLMQRMKDGRISKALMPSFARWRFARSSNKQVKALAKELFGTINPDRAAVIADYQAALHNHQGDPNRGRAVFEKAACATCHRLGDTGVDVGPGIADVRIKPPEALLADILDPNRMVEERWAAYTITTKDGNTFAGLITAETATAITLKLPGGHTETIPRDQIATMQSQGRSLMPVGLESAVSKAEMADLLAFLKAP